MAKDYTHVRLEPPTLRELERVRASMLVGEMMGLNVLQHDPRHRVSLDQVIRRLIAFRDRHAERSRRSKARRAALRRQAALDDTAEITVPLLRSAVEE